MKKAHVIRIYSVVLLFGILGAQAANVHAQTTPPHQSAPPQNVNTTAGISIRPTHSTTGWTTAQYPAGHGPLLIRAMNDPSHGEDSILQIENKVGNISVVLPIPNAQPASRGVFTVFKQVSSGNPIAIFDVVPGSDSDSIFLHANTEIDGLLTVSGGIVSSGGVQFGGGYALQSPFSGSLLLGAPDGNQVTSTGSIAIGGTRNRADGYSTTVIGGHNYGSNENRATGLGSVIIGGTATVANSPWSAVLGAAGGRVEGVSSHHSVVVGGGGNIVEETAGTHNTLVGGGNNLIKGGSLSVILGGQNNEALGNEANLALLSTENSKIYHARGAAIIGGSSHEITTGAAKSALIGGHMNGIGATESVIVGSSFSMVGEGGRHAVIGGASNHVANGFNNAIIGGALNETTTGVSNAVVLGENNRAAGNGQVVMGKFNQPDGSKMLVLGGGSNDSARTNVFTVDWTGAVNASALVAADIVAGEVQAELISADIINASALAADEIVAGEVQAELISADIIQVNSTQAADSDISMGVFTSGAP